MTCRRVAMILSLALAFLASGAIAYANSSGVAVIIGNRHYQGAVPEVSYAHRDAEAFKRYVLDALGYDSANVIDLRDATQAQMVATFGNEKSAHGNLWSYLDPAGGSDVVVFYSGHGVPGQRDGKGYLLPADADPNVPELNAYPIDLLYSNLAKLDEAGSMAVFLDACFSGGSQRGMLIENASPVYVSAALPTAVAGAMTVLTAASGGQLASWDTAAGHGMFTHHLLDALYGKGDADADGRVSAAEAKRYLDRNMTRAARRTYKRNQVASLLGDGDMALALAGAAGFSPRPALGPGGVSSADIEELDGVRWAKQRTNLRSGPSTEHPVAGALETGEEVAVKGQVRGKDWLLVVTAEGNEAFVFAPLLVDQPPSLPSPARDTAQETVFWQSVKDGGAAGLQAYLQQYPKGAFAPLALARLRALVWAPIENSTKPEVFEAYIADNPDGHFVEPARAALRQHIEQADESALDAYLSRYPQGAAADLARERLAAADWEDIRNSADPRVFEAYLETHPDGPFGEPALAALRQRIQQATKSALDRYLARYPQGAAANLARERLPAAEWEEIRNTADPHMFEAYLGAYPDGPFAEPALAALRQRIQQATKSALDRYLDRYPQGAAANLARERLPAAEWEEIRDGADPRVFEAYLAAYPDGLFAEQAHAALRQRIQQADKSALDSYLDRYPQGNAAGLAHELLPTAAWERIHTSDDFRVFWDYLQQYPSSSHIGEAERRLRDAIGASSDADALDRFAAQQATSTFAQEARQRAATLVWQSFARSVRKTDFDAFLRRYPNSREALLAAEAKAAVERLMSSFETVRERSDGSWVGRDCTDCPEMVVVPAGLYRMGSPSQERGRGDDEGPVHAVAIGAPFALGVYEVTFAEWDACKRGCPRGKQAPSDRGWGRGRRPVINVSWDDAKRYAQWLSRKTRKAYRLPSEAEWEYAARAGTATAYSWGDQIGVNRANCRGCGSQWDGSKTAPVGSFRANAWGLHDMHGNVWEWTEDCWNGSYRGAPSDGSAWLRGNCDQRVLRGGSWSGGPSDLGAADRYGITTGGRSGSFGFRVARTLTP